MSTFFKNYDNNHRILIPGESKIKNLQARAILMDMEERVVNEIKRSAVSELFSSYLVDSSGSGNNWAVGYHYYGKKYRDEIVDLCRQQVEECDCCQSFFLVHSLGGGTGSGFGSFVVETLEEEFPLLNRMTISVSGNDDVVTSPYNNLFSLDKLCNHSDVTLPIENQALCRGSSGKNVNEMNNSIARLMLSMTSSVRFEGPLNLDLGEIVTNLVPFPRLHFLLASVSDSLVMAFDPCNQMCQLDPRQGKFMACAWLVRGSSISWTDIQQTIQK